MTPPPLVCLHGFLGEAGDFDALREALDLDLACVAIDLPGHGVRPCDLEADGFEAGLDQVRRQILDRGIRHCHLLGYSMGGRIALGLLARHPKLVTSVVIVGASAGIEDATERSQRCAHDHAVAERLESGDFAEFLDGWYQQPLFALLRRDPQFPTLLRRRLRGHPAALAQALRAFGVGGQPCLHDNLAASTTPILLIAGAQDAKYVESNKRLAARYPSAACRTVPGAGHAPHLENQSDFVDLLSQYLAPQQEHP